MCGPHRRARRMSSGERGEGHARRVSISPGRPAVAGADRCTSIDKTCFPRADVRRGKALSQGVHGSFTAVSVGSSVFARPIPGFRERGRKGDDVSTSQVVVRNEAAPIAPVEQRRAGGSTGPHGQAAPACRQPGASRLRSFELLTSIESLIQPMERWVLLADPDRVLSREASAQYGAWHGRRTRSSARLMTRESDMSHQSLVPRFPVAAASFHAAVVGAGK